MRATNAVALISAFAGWLVLLGGGCGSGEPAVDLSGETTSELPAVNVSVVELKPVNFTENLVLAGRIEPWVEVDVSTELGGTVEEVSFDKGQFVQAGRVLTRIGSDLRAAELEAAEADLMDAEAHFNKTSNLLEKQAVTRQELVSATSRYKMAHARAEQARIRLERSILKAPISGVAIRRDVEPGEVVLPGAAITTLHSLNRVKVVTGVPENDISFFKVNGGATVTVDAYPGRELEGRIHYLGPAATEKTRSFPVEIEISNAANELMAGMIARVSLLKNSYPDALVVPRDALLERDEGSVVFVVKDGRATERQVVTGPSEANRVVVLEGLTPGDQLILSGQRNLVDGQPVRIVRED